MDAAPKTLALAIGAELATCGVTYFGPEFLPETGRPPPRYVWIPATDAFVPASYLDEPDTDDGIVEEVYGSFVTTFVVHIWGATYEQTHRMRLALITVARRLAVGNTKIGGAEWIAGGPGKNGWAVLQTITLQTPIVEQTTPAVLGDDIVDAKSPKAVATISVANKPTFE